MFSCDGGGDGVGLLGSCISNGRMGATDVSGILGNSTSVFMIVLEGNILICT